MTSKYRAEEKKLRNIVDEHLSAVYSDAKIKRKICYITKKVN